MVALTLKTKEQTLGFYPELAEYLSKFKAPLVGLLGNFSTGEMLVVEHATNGLHTVISVPKVDGTLRYDLMTELYSGSKRYDTVANIEFPIGKAVNYETFLVIEGGGRALTLHEQPDWNPKSFRLQVKILYNRMGQPVELNVNGIPFTRDPEGSTWLCSKSAFDHISSEIVSGSNYQGMDDQTMVGISDHYYQPYLVYRGSSGPLSDQIIFKMFTLDEGGVINYHISLSEDSYVFYFGD